MIDNENVKIIFEQLQTVMEENELEITDAFMVTKNFFEFHFFALISMLKKPNKKNADKVLDLVIKGLTEIKDDVVEETEKNQ